MKGCDVLILLDNIILFRMEKDVFGNVNLVCGFDVIDRMKVVVEKICFKIVFCVDLFVIVV